MTGGTLLHSFSWFTLENVENEWFGGTPMDWNPQPLAGLSLMAWSHKASVKAWSLLRPVDSGLKDQKTPQISRVFKGISIMFSYVFQCFTSNGHKYPEIELWTSFWTEAFCEKLLKLQVKTLDSTLFHMTNAWSARPVKVSSSSAIFLLSCWHIC